MLAVAYLWYFVSRLKKNGEIGGDVEVIEHVESGHDSPITSCSDLEMEELVTFSSNKKSAYDADDSNTCHNSEGSTCTEVGRFSFDAESNQSINSHRCSEYIPCAKCTRTPTDQTPPASSSDIYIVASAQEHWHQHSLGLATRLKLKDSGDDTHINDDGDEMQSFLLVSEAVKGLKEHRVPQSLQSQADISYQSAGRLWSPMLKTADTGDHGQLHLQSSFNSFSQTMENLLAHDSGDYAEQKLSNLSSISEEISEQSTQSLSAVSRDKCGNQTELFNTHELSAGATKVKTYSNLEPPLLQMQSQAAADRTLYDGPVCSDELTHLPNAAPCLGISVERIEFSQDTRGRLLLSSHSKDIVTGDIAQSQVDPKQSNSSHLNHDHDHDDVDNCATQLCSDCVTEKNEEVSQNSEEQPHKEEEDLGRQPNIKHHEEEDLGRQSNIKHHEEERTVGGPKFSPPVYIQRYQFVQKVFREYGVTSVVDFGSAELKINRWLKDIETVTQMFLVDIDQSVLEYYAQSAKPMNWEHIFPRSTPLTISILAGSAGDLDQRVAGCQAASLVEIIEHLEPEMLGQVTHCVFGRLRPSVVVVTTPNSEFNVLFPNHTGFRHWDHKFEWTREEFQKWCSSICERHGYSVSYSGLGNPPPEMSHVGCCSQAAIFTEVSGIAGETTDKQIYEQILEVEYPVDQRTTSERLANEVDYIVNLWCREGEFLSNDKTAALVPVVKIVDSIISRQKNHIWTSTDIVNYLQENHKLSEKGDCIVIQFDDDKDSDDGFKEDDDGSGFDEDNASCVVADSEECWD